MGVMSLVASMLRKRTAPSGCVVVSSIAGRIWSGPLRNRFDVSSMVRKTKRQTSVMGPAYLDHVYLNIKYLKIFIVILDSVMPNSVMPVS